MPGVAVLLVGEIRSLIYPVVQRRLEDTLLRPLHADAFLVGSRRWSDVHIGQKKAVGREHLREVHYDVPAMVNVANISRIRAALPTLRAVALHEDDELLQREDRSAWLEHATPSPGAAPTMRLRCPSEQDVGHSKHYVCITHLVHTIRLRIALALLEQFEEARGSPYDHVGR